MMKSVLLAACAAFAITGAAWADDDGETIGPAATAEEQAKVAEAIAKIGCKAQEVEKESDRLFEVDDAECEIGQYDIKLDGEYSILSITRDF